MQEQIIPLLQAKDKLAIQLLYDNYAAALFGIVYRIVSSKELAEQVMQDTFVKAWRNGENYDETKGRLFTWLLNIARNTAIDATRTSHFRHSHKTVGIENLVEFPGNDGFNPDTIGLREAIEEMDDKYRLLIDLVYFRAFTQQEVSQKLNMPLGTVKTRIRHALSSLRLSFV